MQKASCLGEAVGGRDKRFTHAGTVEPEAADPDDVLPVRKAPCQPSGDAGELPLVAEDHTIAVPDAAVLAKVQ